jgi:hypothetical protein
MQMHFYNLPGSDIAAVKKDKFRDRGEKQKLWKHKLKNKLKIQSSDTPATVRERVDISFKSTTPRTWITCWIYDAMSVIKYVNLLIVIIYY